MTSAVSECRWHSDLLAGFPDYAFDVGVLGLAFSYIHTRQKKIDSSSRMDDSWIEVMLPLIFASAFIIAHSLQIFARILILGSSGVTVFVCSVSGCLRTVARRFVISMFGYFFRLISGLALCAWFRVCSL